MTQTDLLEKLESIPPKIGNDFLDRLSIRIFCVPSLLTYMDDMDREGNIVEIVFRNLPSVGIEAVRKLIGRLPTEVYKFSKEGKDYVAFKIDISSAAEDEEREIKKSRDQQV